MPCISYQHISCAAASPSRTSTTRRLAPPSASTAAPAAWGSCIITSENDLIQHPSANHRRAFSFARLKTCHCEPARTLVRQSVPPRAMPPSERRKREAEDFKRVIANQRARWCGNPFPQRQCHRPGAPKADLPTADSSIPPTCFSAYGSIP